MIRHATTTVVALAALAAAAAPALALEETRPVAEKDMRLRVAPYDPDQIFAFHVPVGQAARIVLDEGEVVEHGKDFGLVRSDQAVMRPEEPDFDPEEEAAAAAGRYGAGPPPASQGTAGGADAGTRSCNANMCTTVLGNTVYVMPVRGLDAQPFFLRTRWCLHRPPAPEYCTARIYAFQVTTEAPTVRTADASGQATAPGRHFWSLRFDYGAERRKADQWIREASLRARRAEAGTFLAAQPPAPRVPAAPEPAARFDYAYCSSAPHLWPDAIWRQGTTTFLRYHGARPLPSFTERRPDGAQALLPIGVEPEPSHTTVRIGALPTTIYLTEGGQESCAVYVGPDPVGRAEPAFRAPRR
jgi:type IV secretory pathway VirB9-like protein